MSTKMKEGARSSGDRAYQGLSPILSINSCGSHLPTISSRTIPAGFDPSRAKTCLHPEPSVMKSGCRQFVSLPYRTKKWSLVILFSSKNVCSEFQQDPSQACMVVEGLTSLYYFSLNQASRDRIHFSSLLSCLMDDLSWWWIFSWI